MNDTVVLDPSNHDIHNLNVISSTKINQKVTQILRIFGVLPPVSSAQSKDTEDASASSKAAHKEGVAGNACTVVAIRAKANVASKLISIVEILKRDLARRANESHETFQTAAKDDKTAVPDTRRRNAAIQRIYQYTSVTTIPAEVKIKPPQPKPTSQPPSTTPPAPEDPQKHGTKRKRPVDSSQDSTTTAIATAAARTSKKQKSDTAPSEQDGQPETTAPEEDEDEDFQVMATAKDAAAGGAGKDGSAQPSAATADASSTQIRDVPLLTVYLCSKPLDVLERTFGEQCG